MISYGEVEKLRSIQAVDQSVLSLYVYVPPDSASLGQLESRAVELIEAAVGLTPDTMHREDELLARRALGRHAAAWLGHTLGIFVSEQLGLLEVIPLPGRFAERAVITGRPHLRPALAALERYPDHRIAVIDHRHAWLFTVTGDRIEVVARVPAEAAPIAAFEGWYLEPCDSCERITRLVPHRYHDAAAILDRQARNGNSQPLVVGGHADDVTHLLVLVPPAVLTEYAGSFTTDPCTLTLGRARELAAPVIAHWAERRESQLVQAVTARRPGMPAAIQLEECLTAVDAGTVDLLLVADEPIVPGFHCERCDVLSVSSDGCCDWGSASWPVPDLLEEMVWRTLHAGRQVVSARTLPFAAVAWLE